MAEGVGFEPAAFAIESSGYKPVVPRVYRPDPNFGQDIIVRRRAPLTYREHVVSDFLRYKLTTYLGWGSGAGKLRVVE
jgi:hypothetical protein